MIEDDMKTITTNLRVKNGPPVPAIPDLPPDRQKAVEAGLMAHQQIANERDWLRNHVGELKDEISALKIRIDEMERMRNTIESRINTCIAQRDEAVYNVGRFQGLFTTIEAALAAFNIPPGSEEAGLEQASQ
jgi:hypothetical protein